MNELKLKETDDGELFFNIPDDVLERLGWEEGDEIKFIERDSGFLIKKVKYETIELDFNEDELFKYMRHAHKQGLSFNEWVEEVMSEFINQHKS
jgi:bifunctional DNA-binding transcriptional regulator/antitoxin component of YhaV-PrlF toxin-antitoxin module